MTFGMPTLLETKSLEDCAALCHELELAFIELNMDLPEYQADMLDPAQLSDIARRFGIYYTIHLEDTASPWDFNKRIATAYTETVLQTIRIAKQLSIPVLNMHFHQGEYFTLPERKAYLFKEYPYEYCQKLIAFREFARRLSVTQTLKYVLRIRVLFSLTMLRRVFHSYSQALYLV